MANFTLPIFFTLLLQIIVSGNALAPLEQIDLAGKASSLAPDLSQSPNTGVDPSSLKILTDFDSFVKLFYKTYPTVSAQKKALDIFTKNYKTIIAHNNLNSSYTLGIYETMDQAFGLFNSLGFYPPTNLDEFLDEAFYLPPELEDSEIPESWDWRNHGAVTPVKNQGQCGSCWAFSSTGAVEGANFVQGRKPLVSLSEQELLDCTTSGFTCETGGLMVDALNDVQKNGLGGEACYPYTEVQASTCGRTQACEVVEPGQVSGLYTVHPGDEEELKKLVYFKGPVAIAVYVDDVFFVGYRKGIMFRPNCNLPPNHAVLIVGYGRENGMDFWIVKNQWGESWGENGYFRMQRNTVTLNLGIDYCGVTTYAVTTKMD